MPQASSKKTDADDPVAEDHHSGEKSVAGKARCFRPSANHHGDNERDFNSRYSQSEHQCAERLTHPKRDDFGMKNGCKNGCDQKNSFRSIEHHSRAEYEMYNEND